MKNTREGKPQYKPRKCVVCSKKFTPTRKDRIYCTKKCKDRAIKISRKYGITSSQIHKFYKKIKGKCEICGVRGDIHELGFMKRESLCIDHDHTTGKFRGLLCGHCNKGLGYYRDNVESLREAIRYLNNKRRKLEKD